MVKYVFFIPVVCVWGMIVYAGLSGHTLFSITSSRDAVIYLGIFGMLLCTVSIIRFVSTAPGHPMTIVGYILGTIALGAFAVQLFKWNVPLLENPKTALLVISGAMLVKFVIARFSFLLTK